MSQPYRDDHEALETRLTALEQELEAVRARKRQLDEAVRREAELTKEAEAVRRRVSHMRARRALPLLESLRVASPCKADWSAMVGDDTVRFCGGCAKNVYDLSGMTRDQAEAFVREREGSGACIRLHKRADGTVLTSDCPVGASNARMRRVGALAVGAALMGGGAALLGARTTVMGDMQVTEVGKLEPIDVGQVDPSDTTSPPIGTGTTEVVMGEMAGPAHAQPPKPHEPPPMPPTSGANDATAPP